METRRDFLLKSAVGLTALCMPGLAVNAGTLISGKSDRILLRKKDRILYQGDSITDAGRDKGMSRPNYGKGMGKGYALLSASKILDEHPDMDLKFYNRGISGDTIVKLKERWDADCIALRPGVVSLLIGVNDYQVSLKDTGGGDARKFEDEYGELLQMTRDQLSDVRLMIGEPFALDGITGLTENWKDFHTYREAAKRVAHKYRAAFIPYQSVFEKAMRNAPAGYFSTDGVHPSLAGIYLMSQTWLSTVRI